MMDRIAGVSVTGSDTNRCTVCGQTRNVHKHNGTYFCKRHLNERLAREGL